jgi:NitT/TauT family transport system substrate-binding protein
MHFRISPRRLVALGVSAGAVASLAAASGASAQSLTTVRMAYNPNPTNTTIVVAQQQGFFKKNGINAVLTPSQNTTALIPALGKQFDMVNVTPPSLLQAGAAGESVTMVTGQTIETKALNDTYFIANKSIKSLKQLKGAKIGVPSLGGTLYEAAVIALNKAGIKKSQVKFLVVPFPDDAGDLANGTIQATATIVPFNGQLLGEGFSDLGDPVLAVTFSKTGLDIGWGASRSWALAHASVLKAFVKSQNEAVAWIKSHHAATVSILEKDFQLPAQAAAHIPPYQYFSFGLTKTEISDWVTPMKAVGDLPTNYHPNYGQLITAS